MTFRYFAVTEDFEVCGTNSLEEAKKVTEWAMVFDSVELAWIHPLTKELERKILPFPKEWLE